MFFSCSLSCPPKAFICKLLEIAQTAKCAKLGRVPSVKMAVVRSIALACPQQTWLQRLPFKPAFPTTNMAPPLPDFVALLWRVGECNGDFAIFLNLLSSWTVA